MTAHVPRGDGEQFTDALATRITAAVDHAHTEQEQLQAETAVRLWVVLTPRAGADAGFTLLATRATSPLVLG